MSVNQDTHKADARGFQVEASPGKVSETLSKTKF
jgi:hypothetical protein